MRILTPILGTMILVACGQSTPSYEQMAGNWQVTFVGGEASLELFHGQINVDDRRNVTGTMGVPVTSGTRYFGVTGQTTIERETAHWARFALFIDSDDDETLVPLMGIASAATAAPGFEPAHANERYALVGTITDEDWTQGQGFVTSTFNQIGQNFTLGR